jgi:aminopeptidase N
MTEDLVRFINREVGQDLTVLFDQYLRRAALPVLELAFNEKEGTLAYRWNAEERAFTMPVKVGDPKNWITIRPTTDWQVMKAPMGKDELEVATDLYYVTVIKQ